jgi:hypothetical protein
MKKLIIVLFVVSLMVMMFAIPAFANPATPACNGLDVAHSRIHASGTQGELQLHDLRIANHCGH